MFKFYADAFKNCLDFSGRTEREAFWKFFAVHFAISLVLFIINKRLDALYLLIAFLPMLSIACRRIRDAGFNPLLTLCHFLPVIGTLITLFLCAQPTKKMAE